MSDSELWKKPATELAALIESKAVSPTEILDSVLDRLDAVQPKIHPFITVTDELARTEAAAADGRALKGERIGPMDGIPYSIKDLEDTAGIRTTSGSKFLEHNVPEHDSVVAGRLRSSGGVLLGKTNTPHFGYKGMCDNYVAEPTLNPWDTSTTPGGSSGGAAAAVAAGVGPLAQGSDGAGSIRIPAALCGIVGFKPSAGRIPVHPYREYWSHRTHNGPLTRTVADAALMTSVMAGNDDRDWQSLPDVLEPFHPLSGDSPLAGVKVRWSADLGYGLVAAEVERIVSAAAGRLEGLGCVVEDKAPGWEDPSTFHEVIYSTQLATGVGRYYDENPEWVEPSLRALVEKGRTYSAGDLREAEIARGVLYNAATALFAETDFLVTPAMPVEAWSTDLDRGAITVDGKPLPMGLGYLSNPFNLTGHPAITIPCGFTEAGLPVGLQIVGKRHADTAVLQFAEALERHLALPAAWPSI